MTDPPIYVSFLIRLWRETSPELPETTGGWQGEVEHIQTSRRWMFSSLDELLTARTPSTSAKSHA